MEEAFYSRGLKFECTRCSRCCRHSPGYVFLSPADLSRLAKAKGMSGKDFHDAYCRKVPLGIATRISLKEKPNFDCVFWENGGCTVYEARPLQCRSFPFWSANVASREAWENQANRCPGIGRSRLHSLKEIEDWVALRQKEGFLEG